MRKGATELFAGWRARHYGLAAILVVPGLYVIGKSLYWHGRAGLPWRFDMLAAAGLVDVSLTGTIIFALVLALCFTGLALCLTGAAFGPYRLNWLAGLIVINGSFGFITFMASRAEMYFCTACRMAGPFLDV